MAKYHNMWKKIRESRIKILQTFLVVVVGLISIILSLIFEIIDWQSTAIGLISIALSSASTPCIEKILSLGDDDKFEKFINGFCLVIGGILSILIVTFLSKKYIVVPVILSIIGYILSIVLWCYQNRNNANLSENVEAALGGKI